MTDDFINPDDLIFDEAEVERDSFALHNCLLIMRFHITTAFKNDSDSHLLRLNDKANITISKVMHMFRGMTSGESKSTIDIYSLKPKGWYPKYLTLQLSWYGNSGGSAREIINLLAAIINTIFNIFHTPLQSIDYYKKDPLPKLIISTADVSQSYPLNKILTDLSSGINENICQKYMDAADGAFELVSRMLKSDNRLCLGSMEYMLKHMIVFLERSMLFNTVRNDICCLGNYTKTCISKHPDINIEYLFRELAHDDERYLFICETIRKKKKTRKICLHPSSELSDEYKHFINCIRYSSYMKILRERHSLINQCENIVYSLSPLFDDNEMYWCVMVENIRNPRHEDDRLLLL